MKKYQDAKVEYTFQSTAKEECHIVFKGKSTAEGTEQFITWIEEEIQELGEGKLNILMDLTALTSTPLRVQLRMGSWLLTVKNKVRKVALVGGGRTAKALAKGAKMSNIDFFAETASAKNWLTKE